MLFVIKIPKLNYKGGVIWWSYEVPNVSILNDKTK